MIKGISHITLVARDIEKSADLFKKLFGAREVYSSGEAYHSLSKEKYLLVNGIWIAIMEGDPLKEKTYNHIAFKVDTADLARYPEIIAGLGLETESGRERKPEEGQSIYFTTTTTICSSFIRERLRRG